MDICKELIFNNTIEGIIIIKKGFIVDLNQPLLNILDYDNKEDLIGNLASGIFFSYLEKYVKYNHEVYQEVTLCNSGGKAIPSVLKKDTVTVDGEELLIVYVLDLTDFKEKENLLIQKSKLESMGNLLSMIAHQWRQPLTVLSGMISRLKLQANRGKLEQEKVLLSLDKMENHLSFLSTTIDDFKDFFKKDEKLSITNFDVVFNCALGMIAGDLEENRIQLNFKILNNLSYLYLGKTKLVQVMLSILNNAQEVLLDKGISKPTIDVEISECEKYQTICITDNAGGVPPELLDKIYEPYFSTKLAKNGTGVGLYMSKMIVERYANGSIRTFNTQEGACFEIKMQKSTYAKDME